MVLYNCECCNFSSKIKTHYNRHLKTKKHSDNSNSFVISMVMNTNEHKMNTNEHKMNTNEHKMNTKKSGKIETFECEFCFELFNTKPSKRRHELHYCKQNKNINKLLNEKNKQIKKLEKTVDKLIDKAGNTTINHIQSNQLNQLNQQNNIKINNYGDEDLSHITDFFKTQLIKGPYGAIPKMIKAIHFNNDKPENKNIKYPNVNKNYVKIMQNNKWVVKNKQEILKDMIDSKYLILDDHYNLILNGENISKNVKKNYIHFSDKYDEGNNNLLNELIDDCELVILNNRN